MPNPDPRLERRRPTDEELDRAAEVTADDIDEAVAAFNRYAPAEAKGILDAKPVEEK